jgi:hypothetical protein
MGAAAVAEAEDSMVDTLAVVIGVGILEGIMLLLYLEDTLVDTEVGIMEVTEVGTMVVFVEDTGVEAFTHIGDGD